MISVNLILFKSCFKILTECLYVLFSEITVVVGLHPDYNLEIFQNFLFNLGFILHDFSRHCHRVGIKRLAEGDIAHRLNSKALQKLGVSGYNDLGKIGKTNVTLLTEDILYDYCCHVKYYEDTRTHLRSCE